MPVMKHSRVGLVVFALRVVVGALFLWEAFNQLRKGWVGGDGLQRMIRSAIDGHAVFPPMRYFLEHVVVEYDGVFTILVLIGEIAVGVAIIAGLFTQLTAVVALSMNVNFLLLNGATWGGLIDALWIVFEAVIIVFAARQRWSVDGLLRRRSLPPWLRLLSGAD